MLKPALFALLSVIALSASADTFTFSYAFNGSYGANATVVGSITGTQTGDTSTGLVTNIQVLSMQAIGGIDAPAPLYIASLDPVSKQYTNSAVMSFDPTQNNFSIGDADVANGGIYQKFYFSLLPQLNQAWFYPPGAGMFSFDRAVGTWTLTNTTESVSDQSTTIGLISISLCGMHLLNRRRGRARA